MGYHIEKIPKGILGELSKVEEEVAELADAFQQGNRLMALQELSDIYGAVEHVLSRRFPGFRMHDLAVMAEATHSAFCDGTRKEVPRNITFETLRANCTSIHFFGLGFIQIKLGEFERVHVYHPALPAFVDEPHDHRYDFESTVLLGELVNTRYQFAVTRDDCPTEFEMGETSCNKERPAKATKASVMLLGKSRAVVPAGESYVMGRDEFHTIATSPLCITHLRRSVPVKENACVVRRIGEAPVCPFSQIVSETQLWEYVHDAFQSV